MTRRTAATVDWENWWRFKYWRKTLYTEIRKLDSMSAKGIHIEEEIAVELQHVNVKLLLKDPARVDLHAVVPVFHSWIQERSGNELLLDVASYAHVKDGPGILLIGHEADYSLDLTDGRLGLRYNRKALLEGTSASRLDQAVRAALNALERLEHDGRLRGKIQFDGRGLEMFINDRLLAPNTEEIRRAVDPELRAFLGRLLADEGYSLAHEADPRRLFGARVQFDREFTVRELMQNLSQTASQYAGL